MTDAQKPVAWISTHELMMLKDGYPRVVHMTETGKHSIPLYAHPADDEALQVAFLMLSQAQARVMELESVLRRVIASDDAHSTIHADDGDDVARMIEYAEAFDAARAALSKSAALQQIADIGQLQAEPAPRLTVADLTAALRRAFSLGQTYWQQADSEYTSQHRKADETAERLKELIAATIEARVRGSK